MKGPPGKEDSICDTRSETEAAMYPPPIEEGKCPTEPSAPPNAACPPPAPGIPATTLPPQEYNVHCHHHHPPFPVPAPPGPRDRSGWTSGLCHCFDDPSSCFVTTFCPCITFGQIAEIVDRGATSCVTAGLLYTLVMYATGLGCVYSCFYRSRLRAQYNLVESPAADVLVHLLCEPCALCQEYRELKARGYDLSIGWQANFERQNRAASFTVPPPVAQGMIR